MSPLTDRGIKQAEIIAEKLKNKKFDAIFSSEFLRARQTAEIVNKFHNKKIIIDSRINEVNVGFEGKTDEEFDKARKSFLDEFTFKLKGKESWNDTKNRVGNFLNWLKKQNYGCVLIVSHQWIIGIANQLIRGLTNKKAMQELLATGEYVELELI